MADAALSIVGDSMFGLLATFLAMASRDVTLFSSIPIDAATGHRYFNFPGVLDSNGNLLKIFVCQRPHAGFFVNPGVNFYMGDQVAINRKDKPQRWVAPVFIHVMVPNTDEALVGEKNAKRLSESVQNAFEVPGGRQPLYDFSSGTPEAAGGFVSWTKHSRGAWRELGDPTKEIFTNRQLTFQVTFSA